MYITVKDPIKELHVTITFEKLPVERCGENYGEMTKEELEKVKRRIQDIILGISKSQGFYNGESWLSLAAEEKVRIIQEAFDDLFAIIKVKLTTEGEALLKV